MIDKVKHACSHNVIVRVHCSSAFHKRAHLTATVLVYLQLTGSVTRAPTSRTTLTPAASTTASAAAPAAAAAAAAAAAPAAAARRHASSLRKTRRTCYAAPTTRTRTRARAGSRTWPTSSASARKPSSTGSTIIECAPSRCTASCRRRHQRRGRC